MNSSSLKSSALMMPSFWLLRFVDRTLFKVSTVSTLALVFWLVKFYLVKLCKGILQSVDFKFDRCGIMGMSRGLRK